MFIVSPEIRSRRTLRGLLVIGLAIAASACAPGADEQTAEPTLAEATTTEATTDEDTSTEDTATEDTSDEATTGDDAAAVGASDDERQAATGEIVGGPCTAIQFPFYGFASVIDIPENDPDGGLNIRETPSANGAKLDTIDAGTVVETGRHSDIRCATDADGNIWWYVYGPTNRGWANTTYLGEHADDQPTGELVSAHRSDDRRPTFSPEVGPCTWAQFPRSIAATVIGGDLTMHQEPSNDSESTGTLPAGSDPSVGFHADIRCATDPDGNVWWYVYGNNGEGWVDSGFLDELPLDDDSA